MNIKIKKQIQEALHAFSFNNLSANTIALFKILGYDTSRQAPLDTCTYNEFYETYIKYTTTFNEQQALITHWKYIDILFQLTAEEMQTTEPLFKAPVDRYEPASFLFIAIELSDQIYSRNQLAQIVRELNKIFPMHVFILFKYADQITFSMIDRRPNKKVIDKDVLEKITHIYNISINKPHAGHIQILYTLTINEIASENRKKKIENFKDLHKGWRKVINTDILNKQFYLDYQKLSRELIREIYSKQIKNKLDAHQGVLNLLNRIMFIYFVQKKGWIMKDVNFIFHFWKDYLQTGIKNRFHEDWLNSVFFFAFNGNAFKHSNIFKTLPEPYKSEIINFPYLNGGLFTKNEVYDDFVLDDNYFKKIFDFFENYIFTISEDTPLEMTLEINPELLGKMYEGMINATDLDDIDAENGIIYTERPEINFMVKRSFVEVLDKKLKVLTKSFSRDFLYHFIFDDIQQKKELLRRYKVDTSSLRKAITTVTIFDPACGSGSMLLGAIQLQMDLIRALDEFDNKVHSYNDDFTIKKQLISECLYGVDIKEWAVRIAELRLWLYMISEVELSEFELSDKPLLPNLDFKLRQGNSLLQKLGGYDFTIKDLLRSDKKNYLIGARKKLSEFIKKKKEFVANQNISNTSYSKLKKEEYFVFNGFLDELIIEKKQILQSLGKEEVKQGSFFIENNEKTLNIFEDKKNILEDEIYKLKKLKSTFKDTKKLPFSFDIDFMEIFIESDDPGFDLVIGNPPYVKEEQILPPEDGEFLEKLLRPDSKSERSKANKEYKKLLNNQVYKKYSFLNTVVRTKIANKERKISVYGSKIPGKSDLYVYFQLICPSYLNSNGTFCFIISNSWLDVDFGYFVQQFILKHTKLYAIYDTNVRSFDAAINTVIYLHSAIVNNNLSIDKYKSLNPVSNIVSFVMNRLDYLNLAYAPLLIEQENQKETCSKELYQMVLIDQKELFAKGFDEIEKLYVGEKWYGVYLKAPEIFFKLSNYKIFSKLSSFGRIKLGITSCQNDYFYVNYLIKKKFNIEDVFLEPIFKSPQESKKINISLKNFSNYVLLCKLTHNKLNKFKGINSYIKHGLQKGINKVSCLKSRSLWYNLGEPEKSNVIIPYSYNDNFKTFYCKEGTYVDKRLVQFFPFESSNIYNLLIYLNSSVWFLFLESYGSGNLGEGALIFNTDDFRRMPCFVPTISYKKKNLIINSLFNRDILPIFEELGFNNSQPIREQIPKPLEDRKLLDDIIFDAIGLSQNERLDLYWSLAELVKQRIEKSKSR